MTTVDLDFLIRKTPGNMRKIKAVAKELEAVGFSPFYPVSGLYRLSRDDDSLQVDLMTTINGVKSFNSLRSRAASIEVSGEPVLVASLSDIISSKRAAGRPRDLANLDALERTLRKKEGATHAKGNPPGPPPGK